MMTKLWRLLRNVPVLRGDARVSRFWGTFVNVPVLGFLALLALAAPVFAAETLSTPALPPGVTPEQVEAVRQGIQSGAPIPPEVQKLLESRPDLKGQLPPELREKLEQKEQEKANEKDAGKKPAAAKPEVAVAAAKAELAAAAPFRYDWRKSPYVGGLFSKRLTDTERDSLTHFGHDLFVPSPGAAQLLENIPVGPGYIVGPGDEIVVKMWGRVEGTQRMVVDRDGKIFFPKFGSLYVAGKTFEEMRAFLKSKVSTIAEVSSDVALGQMKGIRVSVVGEVRAPGWYNVSSFQTALQVLSIAGGMKDIGSLRRIKILRGGKEIQEIDLYDLLLAGDTRADIRLQQGDVIFVPVVARLAAIAGEVRRPAIYELRNEKSLLDLVRVAGGFAPSAWKQRVQVERLSGNVSRIVLDASVDELEKGKAALDLSDGDIVRVFPILPTDVNVVTLEGNVARPGRYEMKAGMTVGALVKGVKDFLPETYFDYALLTRLVPPDLHKEVIPVNLRRIVLEKRPEADIPLQAGDTLTVFNRSAFRDLPKATISGEVRMTRRELAQAPKSELQATVGKTALEAKTAVETRTDNNVLTFDIQAGLRVADLVKMAGGLTRLASLDRAEIVRVDDNRTYRTIYFNLGKAMEGDPQENLLLESEDHVRIHSVMETRYRKTVTAAGEVNNPGDYVLTQGMLLSDLLFKSGGFKESAYTKEGELFRREVTPQGDLVKTQTMIVYPDKVLRGEAAADIPLKEYDLLVVRQIPEWAEKIVVTLSGEVQFPGAYAARKGERLSSVITRAGGFTKDAYLKAALFSRASTQKTQQEAIDKLIEDLEVEVSQKSQTVGASLDKEDVEANKELLIARRALIAQLKKTRAKGRVIIHLAGNGKVEGTLGDVLLEDGDRLDVPKKMNVVNVVGRVYNPTGIVFDPAHDSVGYYLRLVGGPTESADRDHIFLLKADGSVVTRETADRGFFAFGERGLMNARVEPGDSILVPEKLVQTRLMKDVKDITQIIFQIAVSAGVLITLF
jgi:protein involved in polysaccharide export with SLBB domain